MQSPEILKRFLRFPLMWVMLLWAVTSPGQEEVVYSFLVTGNTTNSGQLTAPVSDSQNIAETEAAVSWDAQHAPYILLQAGPAAVQLLQFFSFSPYLVSRSGSHVAAPAGCLRPAELLLDSLFPNAP